MRFGHIATTVLAATAAMSITTATAHGRPVDTDRQPAVTTFGNATSGVDHGVEYHLTVNPADRTITAELRNGRFEFTSNGAAVAVEHADGTPATEVPLRYETTQGAIPVSGRIGGGGRTLTLIPTAGEPHQVGSYDRLMEQIYKNQTGVATGAVIGGIIGVLLIPLWLVSIPAGIVLGGIAGGYAMGGQEFIDAVQAFAAGQ
ncbi:hypothetical protein BJY24_003208 [Nocardia transvalensis]|uniref:DUF8020 domain-containing protein n=1 Tax=Nocardia transvalensis TaxID=37333 RepID=A0A7W9UIJ9_9NOCA|nr:hypothetical protein [Nocardia transvalensis]MBB5914341.1 hypothetical protein [Nocardia transvalensis]